MDFSLAVLLVVSLLEQSRSQLLHPAGFLTPSCPQFTALEGFSMARYLGKWYQVERYSNWRELAGKCWVQTYSPHELIPGMFQLRVESRDTLWNTPVRMQADIIQRYLEQDPATLTTQFLRMPITSTEYKILATDYKNYAVEWRCDETLTGVMSPRQSLWILTRTPFPKESVLKQARKMIESLRLKLGPLKQVEQQCHASEIQLN